jgi:hypothetical protein
MNEKQPQEPDLAAVDDSVIAKAFRWSLIAFAAVGLTGVFTWWALTQTAPREEIAAEDTMLGPAVERPVSATLVPAVNFTDITESSGLTFIHENGAYGDRFLPESMGGGVAFLDYDNDGDQDLLFVNSTDWPDRRNVDDPPPTMALYANNGHGLFSDVTELAGLDKSFYGMGVAVGDYDGNGWTDLFITAVGGNHLYRNDSGSFTEVTESAGVGGDDSWSTGAAFFDYDKDGDLDLFVANYVRWSKQIDIEVDYRLDGIGRAYGPPTNFAGTHSSLLRNDGERGFTDVSHAAGIQVANEATGEAMGKALAVVPVDIDDDGFLDLVVANDTVRNFFFHNQGDGTFNEAAVISGLAFDRNGYATGGMGADAAYYRGGANLGIAIGNFSNEMTSLYLSQESPSQFVDEAIVDGVGPASRQALTFGLFFFDYDLDGRLDLLQANGHLEEEINTIQSSQHYEQAPQLFWNCGDACTTSFVAVEADKMGALSRSLVGRGASYADIDGDADLDVVITQPGRRARLLRNDQQLGHHWLRVKLVGRAKNRNAIGAWVEVDSAGTTLRRRVMPTRSYLSQVELPVTFGLGDARQVEALRVVWSDGTVTSIDDVVVDTEILVTQDEDRPMMIDSNHH